MALTIDRLSDSGLQTDPQTNLLELAHFEYSLQDVKDPNLYRMLFSYDEVPKITFNHRLVHH